MAIRKIISLPDPRLRVVTRVVTSFDSYLNTLVRDMFETLYHTENGVGLAATQIGEELRVAVIDVSADRGSPLVLINPEIIEKRDIVTFDEGCLSVPGACEKVKRANWVKFKAQDQNAKWYEMEGEGLLAECVQHEIDHLHGTLYIDLLSSIKRERALKKMEKYKRFM